MKNSLPIVYKKIIFFRKKSGIMATSYNFCLTFFSFIFSYCIIEQVIAASVCFFVLQLQYEIFYYTTLLFSAASYFIFSVSLKYLWPTHLVPKKDPFYNSDIANNKFLIYLAMFWFPLSFFVNSHFCIINEIYFFLMNLNTIYVWSFFFCFLICFLTCGITYHLIIVGWHKQLYLWALVYAFIIVYLYTLVYFLQNHFLAVYVSNFIFENSRYIFIIWAGISYLTGWLWYRKYIQFFFMNSYTKQNTISIANLTILLFFDLYFDVFRFSDWLFISTTYVAIIIWFSLNIFFKLWIKTKNKKQVSFLPQLYSDFSNKIMLPYWVWILHFTPFSQPLLTNPDQWEFFIPFFVFFLFLVRYTVFLFWLFVVDFFVCLFIFFYQSLKKTTKIVFKGIHFVMNNHIVDVYLALGSFVKRKPLKQFMKKITTFLNDTMQLSIFWKVFIPFFILFLIAPVILYIAFVWFFYLALGFYIVIAILFGIFFLLIFTFPVLGLPWLIFSFFFVKFTLMLASFIHKRWGKK